METQQLWEVKMKTEGRRKTPEEGGNGSARAADVYGENGGLEKMVEGEKIQDR